MIGFMSKHIKLYIIYCLCINFNNEVVKIYAYW